MEAVLGKLVFSISNPFRVAGKGLSAAFLHIHDHFIPHPRNNYHPHILGHRSLALSSLLLLSVKIATITLLTAGPVLPAYSSAITTDNIFSLTNQSRQSNGLGGFTYNQILAAAAQSKAKALVECSCFQHNLPDGRTPWDFIKAQKYNYLVAGENLAVNYGEAEDVDEAWMNSPGHRANILNKNYEEIGVGIAQGSFEGHTAIFVVQMFGTPLTQPVKVLDAPTVVAQSQPAAPVKEQPAVAPTVASLASPSTPAQANPEITQNKSEAIQIVGSSVELKDTQTKVAVETTGNVSKVVANYNGGAVLLQPRGNSTWEGYIDTNKLAESNKTVSVKAIDMSGGSTSKVLAGFASNVNENFGSTAVDKPTLVNFFGLSIDPKQIEYRFYLLFATIILTSLVLAIAIRRHVQHLSLVGNASFVTAFAMLLWVA